MSIYSGFATRQQESKYNGLLENLILALKKRLVKFYKAEPTDQDKFKVLIKKIYKQMISLEKGKYLQPKYSTTFSDLLDLLQIYVNEDSLSEMSSVFQSSFCLESNKSEKQQYLKSRNILQYKRNSISSAMKEQRPKQLPTNNIKVLEALDKQDQQLITSINRRPSHTLDVFSYVSRSISRGKLNEIKPLKEMRTTIKALRPPNIQKFIPKKQDIFKQKSFSGVVKTEPKQSKDLKKMFRKHKYQQPDIRFTQHQ